ncbi:SPOR domain-containing protein [Sphingomonas sp. M1-B02]|uniref:SPOR domain-containing protein n=1 Tax=Sphingomonas sp. M1-B02 TaxID=3114300 RepID=UPI002240C511|nr:SPOR domain-containing protein [Sphingomonas sp. S6-11]UZK67375.1 SPOR domain-containing protein [Sphingomonas sp. S6-11]
MNIGAADTDRSDDDRLPWLETVDEDYREGSSIGRTLLYVLLGLVLIAAAVFGYSWYRGQQGATGNGELIAAQEGDYKVKPDEPGGMKVDGEGDSVFATSQGAASNASINVGALPEAPVEGTRAKTGAGAEGTKNAKLAVPAATSAPTRAAAPVRAPAAASAGSGALIQLGAFPSEGRANVAWAQLSKRFAYLAPLGKSIERTERDGETFYRLRVNAGSNGQARSLCGRLNVAGESCFVAN